MHMVRHLLSYLCPQQLARVYSPINSYITVELFRGKPRSVIHSYWQSGEYAEDILDQAFTHHAISFSEVRNVLLLGLGCGSMLMVLERYAGDNFSSIDVDGIEIDPEMISLGYTFFDLGRYTNLRIWTGDAYAFIMQQKQMKYDLIISDVFVGVDSPDSLQSQVALEKVYSQLTPGGIYIINNSYLATKQASSDQLYSRLVKSFHSIHRTLAYPNLLLSVTRDE